VAGRHLHGWLFAAGPYYSHSDRSPSSQRDGDTLCINLWELVVQVVIAFLCMGMCNTMWVIVSMHLTRQSD
jgi:hypothetical protein